MAKDLTQRVDFGIIRYANCWEDADILLEGLSPGPGSSILSVGSAGDNSFSLLARNPDLVVAVDVNKTQLYLVELKKAAFMELSYEELLAFLGFSASAKREELYHRIKTGLSPASRSYWDKNLIQVRQGVIFAGKFERYFQTFSRKILPWIHSGSTVRLLFSEKTEAGQNEFYRSTWNSWQWKLLFRIFFSRYVMGKYGRDPEFLKEVNFSVADFIYRKAEKQLCSVRAQHNFILRFNLTGDFGGLLPHYVRGENFEAIRSRIGRLHILEGYAEDAVRKYGPFHGMNLSNIFEYMSRDLFRNTAEELLNGSVAGGRLAYWNLMVPRRISALVPEKAEYLQSLSASLSEIDKGFFYDQFIIDRKK
ncbi:MAG: DUF3419 family protein [Bacteroidota bacterium]